jgi:hypothetical protein
MNISQQVYRVLTKRKYNRNKPYLAGEILKIIDKSLSLNEPIKLVGFWGVGQKDKPNWADEESCKFLYDLNKEIKNVYEPGIEFTFVFANMHGQHNGYQKESINSYTKGMIKIFNRYSFTYVYLDKLWEKYQITFDKINLILEAKPEKWWDEILERDAIEKNAACRNKKYPPRIAAQKYYIMRNLEKEIFEKEFPGYIFHAFSDPRLQIVLPNMPTLYFYGRESWSNAPWFVDHKKMT